MYSVVLDPVLTSLKHPFHNSSFVVYENIESLFLKTIKGEDTSDESEYIKRIYNDEINITQSEMRPTFFAFFSKNYFDSFFSEIRKLPKEQRLFVPRHFTCASSYLSIQARRIKTWRRSKMIPVRFNV